MVDVTQRGLAVTIGIALLASVLARTGRAETFVVGRSTKGYPPLAFGEKDSRKGIWDEILEAISTITHDTFIIKYATTARRLRQFGKEVDIQMGYNPAWRPEDQSISVYTKPFLKYIEVVAIRKEKSLPVHSVEDLKGKTVGDIRGLSWPGWMPEDGGYIADLATNSDMLFRKFKAKRYDIVLTEKMVAKYWAKELDLEFHFAKVIAEWDVSMQLHISKKSALDRLNKALDTLMQEGTIDAIVRKYTE